MPGVGLRRAIAHERLFTPPLSSSRIQSGRVVITCQTSPAFRRRASDSCCASVISMSQSESISCGCSVGVINNLSTCVRLSDAPASSPPSVFGLSLLPEVYVYCNNCFSIFPPGVDLITFGYCFQPTRIFQNFLAAVDFPTAGLAQLVSSRKEYLLMLDFLPKNYYDLPF